MVTKTSSVHCLSNGFGMGKWNFIGRDEDLSCGVVGTGSWLWRIRGMLTLVSILFVV